MVGEEIQNYSLPAIATGLLYRNLKERTDKPLEFDSLKLSDDERRARFGARIKIMRGLLNLTQADLADKLEVTPAAVVAYEKGKREPNFKNLLTLSQALNVTTDWLLGAPPPKSE